MSDNEELLASVFEERAENLSRSDLGNWTEESERDREILEKLTGPGAKLLIGPRGSGKSTLLRRAYFELLDDRRVLAAYVNFSKSLALEPLFHDRADALKLFRQWLVQKIVQGVLRGLEEEGLHLDEAQAARLEKATAYVSTLERGDIPAADQVEAWAPSQLLTWLEQFAEALKRRRVVLLLDDAAHAFSPSQQREFFEVFRELRSRVVSGKAAVYPGITAYSPHFHVGHEAELVQAWVDPDAPAYLTMMKGIVERRLPEEMKKRLRSQNHLLDYLALAAFGLPRSFLFMLSQVLGVEEVDGTRAPTRRGASRAVGANAAAVRAVFQALSGKLPRYKNFVEIGTLLEVAAAASLRNFNRDRRADQKAVVLAIPRPVDAELERVLALLEYAGILRRLPPVSRGVKGSFERFVLHYAIIIAENSLSLGRAPTVEKTVTALRDRDAHAFVRAQATSLLGSDFAARCTLDLAPCSKCGAPRMSDEALFCMRCGAQLSEASVYGELLHASVEKLPLTENKISGLKAKGMKTVQDILLDEEGKKVRSIPYVGPVWAGRIRTCAEEYVSV